jgi:hypothetical protein
MIEAVYASEPPELLLLGEDAVDAFRAVLDAQRADIDAWEHVSRSTNL